MNITARRVLPAALLTTLLAALPLLPGTAHAAPAAASCPDLGTRINALTRHLLRTDPAAVADSCGVALFAEPRPASTRSHAHLGGESTRSSTTPMTAAPAAQAFDLASRPGADLTLYLDFTGADLSGTYWSTRPGAPTPAIASPWDTDGSPSTFNEAERQAIATTWAVVAEDFLPFDVNVTTTEPSPDRLNRASSSDNVYGATMVFTRRNWVQDDCGGCSGMAPFGTFAGTGPAADGYRIGLAFPGGLDRTSTETFARTFGSVASHEFGHILGLLHDGLSADNPNGGRREYAAGALGWSPLMGVSGGFEMSRWSDGDYDYASNTQDDLAILTKALGSAPDDHPDAAARATLLSAIGDLGGGLLPPLGSTQQNGTSLIVAASGVLGTAADVDAFTVSVDRSSTLAVAPSWAGNSDLKAEVFRDGTRVATLAPTTTWDAPARTLSGRDLAYLAEPGEYTILVSADASDTGPQRIASAYGSLGGYLVSVSAG